MVWNAPKINFRKKLLARTDARVYARVWEHDVDRNDNDFVHEKFEWIILTFRCGDTNLLQYYVDRTSKHIFINSTQNASSILVPATKIWNKLPLPIRIPMSPASSFRSRGNGTAKGVNTLTNCWRQPNFFINSIQHICTNPCNFEVSPSASRPSHKWANAVMVQLVLFISGS